MEKTNFGLKRPKTKKKNITFDSYFSILVKKNPKILSHHKNPLKGFFASFGNVESQTAEWFDDKLEKYSGR